MIVYIGMDIYVDIMLHYNYTYGIRQFHVFADIAKMNVLAGFGISPNFIKFRSRNPQIRAILETGKEFGFRD